MNGIVDLVVNTSDLGSKLEEDNSCLEELFKPAVDTKYVLSVDSVIDLEKGMVDLVVNSSDVEEDNSCVGEWIKLAVETKDVLPADSLVELVEGVVDSVVNISDAGSMVE